MIAVYVLLGILLLVTLLLCLPVHLSLTYDGALRIRLRYALIGKTVYPPKSKKKERAEKPSRNKKSSGKKTADRPEPSQFDRLLREEGPSGAARIIVEIARLAGKAAKRFLQAVTVDELRLRLIVAAENAADTATDYGKICAAVYPALAVIESAVRVKKRDIAVAPDFLRERGEVQAKARLKITLWRFLWAWFCLFYGFAVNTMRMRAAKSAARESQEAKGKPN